MNKQEFIDFLKTFTADLTQNPSEWENKTLEDFLGAMIAYTEDIQDFYDNTGLNINADEASWENFMHILRGASIYE